jgi:hypothetical protein
VVVSSGLAESSSSWGNNRRSRIIVASAIPGAWMWMPISTHGKSGSAAAEAQLRLVTIEALTGQRPLGWYTGRTSPRTQRLVVEHGGFLYDADS